MYFNLPTNLSIILPLQENTNKAVIADFFSTESEACTTAFSATAFFTGYSGAIGFFTFHSLPRLAMAGVVLLMAAISCVSYEWAFVMDRRKRSEMDFQRRKMDIVRQRFEECKRSREHQNVSNSNRTGNLLGLDTTVDFGSVRVPVNYSCAANNAEDVDDTFLL